MCIFLSIYLTIYMCMCVYLSVYIVYVMKKKCTLTYTHTHTHTPFSPLKPTSLPSLLLAPPLHSPSFLINHLPSYSFLPLPSPSPFSFLINLLSSPSYLPPIPFIFFIFNSFTSLYLPSLCQFTPFPLPCLTLSLSLSSPKRI